MKLLLLPFLNMPTGHQQVADTIADAAKLLSSSIHCRKVDIFHHGYEHLERWTSRLYLQWIRYFPKLYSSLYCISLCNGEMDKRKFTTYETLFMDKALMLVQEEQPDWIICTHSIPSYIISQLKQRGHVNTKTINVYTDFFMNDAWSTKQTDIHFVPNNRMKQQLLQHGVANRRIFVTGIPVHPSLWTSKPRRKNAADRSKVLIAGGGSGSGSMQDLIEGLTLSGRITYSVLCGENDTLYQFIRNKGNPSLIPLPYISSREEMSALYDDADAILTKTGGVTVSECLRKELPMFVYDALPGQEEINLRFLKQQGLVYHLIPRGTEAGTEEQLIRMLSNEQLMEQWKENMRRYSQEAVHDDLVVTLSEVLQLTPAGKSEMHLGRNPDDLGIIQGS